MKYGIIGVIVIAVLASVLLVGCSPRNELIDPFDEVKYIPQPNGAIYAEVWIEAPERRGCSIDGDQSQNVVVLSHPKGKMALPDRVRYIVKGKAKTGSPDQSGYVLIAVYHLTDSEGTEIGYYKRKFARSDPGVGPPSVTR